MDKPELLSIGETAKVIGVSVDTLRRWDKEGKFPSVRSVGGHRYFRREDVDNFLFDIFGIAKKWVTDTNETDIPSNFYCQTSSVFQARLSRFESELGKIPRLKDFFPLISSLAGEIGNNSYDHNIGNWPGMPGIFFGYALSFCSQSYLEHIPIILTTIFTLMIRIPLKIMFLSGVWAIFRCFLKMPQLSVHCLPTRHTVLGWPH